MAKEYIEREAAKEELVSWARCMKHPEHLMTEDAMCVLDIIPAADVVEVVHGRWVRPTKIGHRSYNIPHCSACEGVPCGVDENTHYCPNCGARMRGAEDE